VSMLKTLCAAIVVFAAAVFAAAAALGDSAPDSPFARDFSLLTPAVPAPRTAFTGMDGARLRLDDFKGSVVLLNFWATWCAPCVREMPSLDRLQARLRPEGLRVLAVSIDRGGAAVVAPFAEKLGLKHLELYLDPKSELSRAFALGGVPSTFLIGAGGRVVRAMVGPAEWDSEEAVALFRHYLKGSGGEEDDVQNAGILILPRQSWASPVSPESAP